MGAAGTGGRGGGECALLTGEVDWEPGPVAADFYYDCSSSPATGCSVGNMFADAVGGTFLRTDGVLVAQSNESGFWDETTTEALFLFREVDSNFLAMTFVQPTAIDGGWPAGAVNLAGLVARASGCNSASCGRWTKFEAGTLNTPADRGLRWATKNVMMVGTEPSDWADVSPPWANSPCPQPALLGLCGLVEGAGNFNLYMFFAVPGGPVTEVDQGGSRPLTATDVEVGLIAASGYDTNPNDLAARFGFFRVVQHSDPAVDINDLGDCQAQFEMALAALPQTSP
jgi:hypothetical protein